MAASEEDVVSLETIKANLRITHSDQDKLLKFLRSASIGKVTLWTGLPLIDTTKNFIASPAYKPTDPIKIVAVGFQSVEKINYWTEAQDQDAVYPAGEIEKTDLLAIKIAGENYAWGIRHKTGFPPSKRLTCVVAECKVGLTTVPKDLVQGIIIIIRDLYDGKKLSVDPTTDALVRPHVVFSTENFLTQIPSEAEET